MELLLGAWYDAITSDDPNIRDNFMTEAEEAYAIFMSKPVRENLITEILPRELRDQIFGYVFKYTATVQPKHRIFLDGTIHGTIFPDHTRDMVFDVATRLTLQQLDLIRGGLTRLPCRLDRDDARQVSCEAVRRGPKDNYFYQVINTFVPYQRSHNDEREWVRSRRNDRSNVLRVNKQFYTEGRILLYKYNRFEFDFGDSDDSFKQIHDADELLSKPERFPNMPNKDGSQKSAHQVQSRVMRLFDEEVKGRFFSKDPYTTFLSQIGPQNAFLMAHVEFTGRMKTRYEFIDGYIESLGLGMAHVLDIHTLTLGIVSPNLRELTLRVQDLHLKYGMDLQASWDEDLVRADQRPDDQKLNDIVHKLADRLPSLRKLNLEGYIFDEEDDDEDDDSENSDDESDNDLNDDSESGGSEDGEEGSEDGSEDGPEGNDEGGEDNDNESGIDPNHQSEPKEYTFIDPWGQAAQWIKLVDQRPDRTPVTQTFIEARAKAAEALIQAIEPEEKRRAGREAKHAEEIPKVAEEDASLAPGEKTAKTEAVGAGEQLTAELASVAVKVVCVGEQSSLKISRREREMLNLLRSCVPTKDSVERSQNQAEMLSMLGSFEI